MNWTTVLSYFAGSVSFFGAAAWLTRSLVQHWLSKDVEKYRAELSTQNAIALERAKSEIQQVLREREIRFGRLHEKRAEVIAELYQHIVETSSSADECLSVFESSPDKIRYDLAKETMERGDELAEFIIRNRIYFSQGLAAILEELSTCLIHLGLEYKRHCGVVKKGEKDEMVESEMRSLKTDISGAMRETEQEFRTLLGVEKLAGFQMSTDDEE